MAFRKLIHLLVLLIPGAALAQTSAPAQLPDDGMPDNFLFVRIEGGILRLAKETGRVSLCAGVAGSWLCRPVADSPHTLNDEILSLSVAQARLVLQVSSNERRMRELSGTIDALRAQKPVKDRSATSNRLSPLASVSGEAMRRLSLFVQQLKRRLSAHNS
jgi:hypothetical protein